jgi:hypothetical protein
VGFRLATAVVRNGTCRPVPRMGSEAAITQPDDFLPGISRVGSRRYDPGVAPTMIARSFQLTTHLVRRR